MSFVDALCCTPREVVHYNFSKIIEVKADIKKEVLGIMACLWYSMAQSVTLLSKKPLGVSRSVAAKFSFVRSPV